MALIGSTIDKSTLASLSEFYDKSITWRQIGAYAQKMIAAEGGTDGNKQERAYKMLRSLKEAQGVGITTMLAIYNATGVELRLRDAGAPFAANNETKDFHGTNPDQMPDAIIQCGQWSVFVHPKTGSSSYGSEAGMTYEAFDPDGVVPDAERRWVWDGTNNYPKVAKVQLWWETPWSGTNRLAVQCTVGQHGVSQRLTADVSVGGDASAFNVIVLRQTIGDENGAVVRGEG